MHGPSDIAPLVAAVQELDPRPRQRRWVSLSFCVLDAVYSIGAHYDHHVVPMIARVATDFRIDDPAAPVAVSETDDPLPLGTFLTRYPDTETLLEATKNRQNTSTRGGIRKADAVLQYATILRDHGIETLGAAAAALADSTLLDTVDAALSKVPGEGSNGVRRGYLWMLAGDDHTVKPDRMVLRWLTAHAVTAITADTARILLDDIASQLSTTLGRQITPWEVDHAIWCAARA